MLKSVPENNLIGLFLDGTKWTVRRLRRRARSSSLRRGRTSARALKKIVNKEDRDKDEKDVDTTESSSSCDVINASSSDVINMSSSDVINAEMLLFGSTLGKHHHANIEVQFEN